MENEIKLTLEPEKAAEEAKTPEEKLDYAKNIAECSKLSPAEEAEVEEFAKKIDISDSEALLQYGSQSQKKTADFSDTALEKVKAKDLGKVGDMLTDLVAELKTDPSQQKGFLGLFRRSVPVEKLKAQYTSIQKNVEKIADALTDHRNTLVKDVAMLDQLYDTNLDCYKEVTMYILAGKKALEDAKNNKLAELKKKAEESRLLEDAQAAADFGELIDRFEKKIHDLELTRTVNMQMAPQIRLIQNNDIVMSEKIQSTINNTIPLWKNQIVIALGLARTNEALKAEKEVTDLTNDLLKKNAETLKTGTLEIAKESERGVVDIETLKETNRKLIETLTEVTSIHAEGRAKRAEAENELAHIEAELRQKLLELSSTASGERKE